jgi:hypothetical protein
VNSFQSSPTLEKRLSVAGYSSEKTIGTRIGRLSSCKA